MIDSQAFITDSQLDAAYRTGREQRVAHTDLIRHCDGCRAVAEMAIAAYVGATLPDRLEQLDRVTAAVERYTGEVLA